MASDWLEKSLSDVGEQTLEKICRTIRHQLIKRGRKIGPSPVTAIREGNSGVTRRRAIVKANPALPDDKLCKRFEVDEVPLALRNSGETRWVKAYQKPKLRQNIHVILTKDRKHAKA